MSIIPIYVAVTPPKTALKLPISPPPPADSSSATPLPSKSRINTVCLSEGDTITEEETYPNTVIDNLADASYATTTTTTEPTTKLDVLPAQKLATIMRSRNRLDRSVLSKWPICLRCTHFLFKQVVDTYLTHDKRARAHTKIAHIATTANCAHVRTNCAIVCSDNNCSYYADICYYAYTTYSSRTAHTFQFRLTATCFVCVR